VVIFAYYMMDTLLPVDKLIGRLYPLFGVALLFMAAGLLVYMLFSGIEIPAGISEGFGNRYPGDADSHPIFPMMFVSIACGAISGFHATQSPMMARCMTSEKWARPIFYGAMVAEGAVALIWAAAAIAFTGSYETLGDYMAAHGNSAGALVHDISVGWLGTAGGLLAILGVVAAPVTTGDTALRSARLIIADSLGFSQASIGRRLAVSIPVFAIAGAVMMIDFSVLWRYFAWSNQTLSVFTLWAVTVWLARRGNMFWIPMIPALFMTVVCVSYILFAPSPEGFGIDLTIATGCGALVAALFAVLFFRKLGALRSGATLIPAEE
ncbi:MAG: carbon starvation protein A, partial [Paramuribaculum sp.]|nr:carbon starvation protein A [Paramuribaculum sp.]